MRKLVIYSVLMTVLVTVVMLFGTAAFARQNSWVELPTGVDAGGKVITTKVFGHYSDLEGAGEVFIECDPDTGEEVGAYIPGVKIGDQKTYTEGEPVKKEIIDWDHPKEALPVQVTLLAPNIPTGAGVDWDYYNQYGEIRRKTVNQFKWPMHTGFNKLIPGSDPDYWLFIASVTNPNPFPVSVNLSAAISSFSDGRNNDSVSKEYDNLIMTANETKYILLNRGLPGNCRYLLDEWPQWDDNSWQSGYSNGYYDARTVKVMDPFYPSILETGEDQGYFKPYVRWDGTEPTVKPLIPMRLAFNFGIAYTEDKYGGRYYDSYKGREWPSGGGHAEYDHVQDKWSIGVSFKNFEKPGNMSDEEWQAVIDKATSNAQTTLEHFFRTWYPKTPFWSAWRDDDAYVNGETGEWYGGACPNPQPVFTVSFSYLEPVPPYGAPPAYPPDRPPGV